MTPREIVHAAGALARRRARDTLTLAWQTASLLRAKRLPRLEALLRRVRGPRGRRPQTPADQVRMAALFTRAFGGRDLRK